jgi:hypothetical protein
VEAGYPHPRKLEAPTAAAAPPALDADETSRTLDPTSAPTPARERRNRPQRPVNPNTNPKETTVRTNLVIGSVLAALALAGTATAADNGTTVVKDAGCITNFFGTTCTVVKTVTNSTVTASGNVSYVTNGTVERTITFVFGGTYTSSNALHVHVLAKQGEIHESGDHYQELVDYVSGTYQLSCVSSYDIHWANGDAQLSRSELECTTP